MISTNKTQPAAAQGEPAKLKVLTTNKLTLRTFSFTPREYPGIDKRQTRKVKGGMLTTIDMEERKRLAKRAAATEALKAIKMKGTQAIAMTEPKKKAGRPKKEK